MVFQGKFSRQSAKILVDTSAGASHCSVNTAFATHRGFLIKPGTGSVSCEAKTTAYSAIGNILLAHQTLNYDQVLSVSPEYALQFTTVSWADGTGYCKTQLFK